MLDRAYARNDFKDGTATYLLPGEKPRERYRFPAPGSPCPHCGKRAGFIHTANYFECWCGTILFNEEPIPWQRESNARLARKPRRREITLTCTNPKCQKPFTTNNHNGMVKWCPECRDDVRREKERAREKAKREKKKATTAILEADSI